ncbi:Acetyl-deacylase [Hyphodiscus hymeniophilus]|uniref:Acetyl-CoA hydrolase n=1 Tax=Hyphodiscus hymeniophilus TaxID=353542 RepID=A0A9P6VDG9_9HELO|nr:Acetyl-deacylase [Hyphodiscus hymeniophilus]
MAPSSRIRPYKDFLTPALHRRFALATAVLVSLCYVEAVIGINEYDGLFWTWFPLGRAGIRTLLLIIPAFMIFVLRVAQLHVGSRTSNSAYQTFVQYAPRWQTIQTVGWYLFSAYLFSEIYIWSAPKTAELNRIIKIRNTERPTLNERPIYLTCFFYYHALVQAGYHLYYDYDRIEMPVFKTRADGDPPWNASSVVTPEKKLFSKLRPLATSAFFRAIAMAALSPIIYYLTVRNFAWTFTRWFAKRFWRLPKSSALPSIPPFRFLFLLRTVYAGFLLIMLWEVGNAAFSIHVSQAPLKNDRPITYESRDPSGSLLTGLNGKKLQTRAFAFWELACISERFEGRRKVIFEDIDRKGGSTWSQILAVCLETITGIDDRIADYEVLSNAGSMVEAKTKQMPISHLPRIGQPLKDGIAKPGDLFESQPPPKSRSAGAAQYFDTISKSLGQSPPRNSSPTSSKVVAKAGDAVLTHNQREKVAQDGYPALFQEWATQFLRTRMGWPFREEYSRRIVKIVLGSPYGDVGVIVDAIDSMTRLAACSLQEDKYGGVQKDVKKIIQTLTATHNKLERFNNSLEFHWTDVEEKRESPEIDIILGALAMGLEMLVEISNNGILSCIDGFRCTEIEAHPEDLIPLFPNGAYIGWSGFTGVGYPKKIPTMLADHVENNNLQGKLKYSLFVGASSGAETENRWAKLNMIDRRSPHQVGKEIAKGINNGNINFFDKHLSMFPVDLVYGFYTKDKPNKKLDVVIVEATAITEDGGIIPGASVGASPELIQMADKIIVEVNTSMPSFEGLHDITMTELPPHGKPYLIMAPEDRIGTTYIPIDTEKIVAIIESDYRDQTTENSAADDTSRGIANHLIEFLEHEVSQGRLPKNLLPIQSGIGNIANAVIGGLAESKFEHLKVWTEVLQDTFLDLFDSGRLDFATATSIRFSPEGFQRFYDGWEQYYNKLLLRSQQVSNSPEIIRRLGVIGMNTPVEVDIYAHANSTCVMGSRMLNGLGGSADFLRSAKYSIMHTPSSRPSKSDPHGVSCIVPMCTHIDQTEHDLDVIVTEQGLADVRGLSPKERAKVIIEKCAHPEYRPILEDYFKKAEFECMRRGWGHEPHLLWNSFDMHKALDQEGSMKKIKTWG